MRWKKVYQGHISNRKEAGVATLISVKLIFKEKHFVKNKSMLGNEKWNNKLGIYSNSEHV